MVRGLYVHVAGNMLIRDAWKQNLSAYPVFWSV